MAPSGPTCRTFLKIDGSLLLAVQGPHRPYERAMPGGLLYTQHVEADEPVEGAMEVAADGECQCRMAGSCS